MRRSLAAALVGAALAGTVALAPAASATPAGRDAPPLRCPAGEVGIYGPSTALCLHSFGVHQWADGFKTVEIDSGPDEVFAYTAFGGPPIHIGKGQSVAFDPPIDLLYVVITR